jgi:hypothetical protein
MLKLLRFDVQQLAKIDGQLVHGRSWFAMSIEDSSFRLSLSSFRGVGGIVTVARHRAAQDRTDIRAYHFYHSM